MSGQAVAGRNPLLFACAALVAGLIPPAQLRAQTPAQPGPAAPVAASPSKGAEAWRRLVGNTVVAKGQGGDYTEYYATNGAVTHLDADGKSTGAWAVEGDKVCFDFPEEDDRSCVDVESDGKTGTFIDEDKSRDTFDVLPGNAKGL